MKIEQEKYFLSIVKGTVGYYESGNKAEFIKGAQVAIGRIGELYAEQIELYQKEIANLHKEVDLYRNDLSTLSSIILKYSE